jgi:hypothetical protein
MTDEKMKILKLLAEAWNKFLELPTEHESDIREFQYGIHVLQRQFMSCPMNIAKLS